MTDSHGVHAASTLTYSHRGRLAGAFAITVVVLVIQITGAILSGSVALLADSGHMLADSLGLALALFAAWLASRPSTADRTFGWKRAEILAALANGLIMVAVGVAVIVAGIDHIVHPPEIHTPIMLAAASLGLVANLVSMRLLASARGQSLNIKGAYLEVWGDMLGSIAVIASALVMLGTGFAQADGIASVLIGLLILPRAALLLRQVFRVLLEQTPPDVNVDELRSHLAAVPGVIGVHDLHVWTITSGLPSLTAHVEVDQQHSGAEASAEILRALQACIREHFAVAHSTVQIEPERLSAVCTSAHEV